MEARRVRIVGGAKHVGGARGHWVFRDLDLDLAPGELFCLLGPSGSGKSTLLRILAGLDHLTSGHVELGSEREEPVRCGLVFQEPMLLPWLDVAGNIELGLRYRRNEPRRSDGLTEEVAEQLGIADLLRRSPGEISGGQAQRVALARTVVVGPQVLLLDEPFAALDSGTRGALQEWLLEVVASLGITTLFVTHDVDEALRLGSRVGVLAGGGAGLSHTWPIVGVADGDVHPAPLRGELIDHLASLSRVQRGLDPHRRLRRSAVPSSPSPTPELLETLT